MWLLWTYHHQSAGDGGGSSASSNSSTTSSGTSTSTSIPSTMLPPPLKHQHGIMLDDGTYEGYIQIMNYMAKEDKDIARMLEDVNKQVQHNPENFRYVLMGFKLGIFSGLRISGSNVLSGSNFVMDELLRSHSLSGTTTTGASGAWSTSSYLSGASGGTGATLARQQQGKPHETIAQNPTTPTTTRIQLKQTPAPSTAYISYAHGGHQSATHADIAGALSSQSRTKLEISQSLSSGQHHHPHQSHFITGAPTGTTPDIQGYGLTGTPYSIFTSAAAPSTSTTGATTSSGGNTSSTPTSLYDTQSFSGATNTTNRGAAIFNLAGQSTAKK